MQMQVASASMLGVALQRGYEDFGSTTHPMDWRKFSYTGSQFGLQQPTQNLPPEAGGEIVPRGAYKSGLWAQGQFSLIPRAVDDIGVILCAAMGKDTVTANHAIGKAGGADAAISGVNIHTFGFNTRQADVPYLSVRQYLEGIGTANALGIQVQEGRIGSMELSLPAVGPLTGNIEITARTPANKDTFIDQVFTCAAGDCTISDTGSTFVLSAGVFPFMYPGDKFTVTGATATGNNKQYTVVSLSDDFKTLTVSTAPTTVAAPDAAALTFTLNWFTDAYDTDTAFPVSVDPDSYISIAGAAVKCSGATISIVNTLLQPDQARVVGDVTPMDFPVLQRSLSIRATVFLENYELYRQMIANATTGRRFSPVLYMGNADIRAFSAEQIGVTGHYYAMQVRTTQSNVSWALQGAPTQNPNQPIIATLVGTVLRPTSGAYAEVRMSTGVSAAFAVPAAG